MDKNYSKEARISKIYADSIIGRAVFVSLLYLLAFTVVFCLVDLALLLSLDAFFSINSEELWTKACEAVPALSALSYTDMVIVKEAIFGAGLFIISVIVTLVKVYSKPKYYKKAKARVKARIRAAKERMKIARSKKNKLAVRREKMAIEELKRRIPLLKRFFRKNRFAKNEHTAKKFRKAKKLMTKYQKTYSRFFTAVMLLIFGYAIYYTSKLDTNTGVTAILDESYSNYLILAVVAGLVFHFLCGVIAGSVPYIRLQDHENTYIHTKAFDLIDQEELDLNAFPLRVEDKNSIRASFPKRWDDSSAILEEKPREYKVTMFFVRNLVQVAFTLFFAVLYVYMYPALHKITEIGVSDPFGLIFSILKWVMAAFIGIFMIYSFSAKEYSYDCMDEDLRSWRNRHTFIAILFFIVVAAYFVLVIIAGVKDSLLAYYEPSFIEEAQKQFAGTFENAYAVEMGRKWAAEYVKDLNVRIVVCMIAGILFSLVTVLSNMVIMPRDKVKHNDDFFAFSSRYKDVPKDSDDL